MGNDLNFIILNKDDFLISHYVFRSIPVLIEMRWINIDTIQTKDEEEGNNTKRRLHSFERVTSYKDHFFTFRTFTGLIVYMMKAKIIIHKCSIDLEKNLGGFISSLIQFLQFFCQLFWFLQEVQMFLLTRNSAQSIIHPIHLDAHICSWCRNICHLCENLRRPLILICFSSFSTDWKSPLMITVQSAGQITWH